MAYTASISTSDVSLGSPRSNRYTLKLRDFVAWQFGEACEDASQYTIHDSPSAQPLCRNSFVHACGRSKTVRDMGWRSFRLAGHALQEGCSERDSEQAHGTEIDQKRKTTSSFDCEFPGQPSSMGVNVCSPLN